MRSLPSGTRDGKVLGFICSSVDLICKDFQCARRRLDHCPEPDNFGGEWDFLALFFPIPAGDMAPYNHVRSYSGCTPSHLKIWQVAMLFSACLSPDNSVNDERPALRAILIGT